MRLVSKKKIMNMRLSLPSLTVTSFKPQTSKKKKNSEHKYIYIYLNNKINSLKPELLHTSIGCLVHIIRTKNRKMYDEVQVRYL